MHIVPLQYALNAMQQLMVHDYGWASLDDTFIYRVRVSMFWPIHSN